MIHLARPIVTHVVKKIESLICPVWLNLTTYVKVMITIGRDCEVCRVDQCIMF